MHTTNHTMRTLSCAVAGIALLVPALLAGATPVQDRIADDEILDAVDRKLFSAKGVPGSVIDVSVDDGIVTLSGEVGDLLAKERATRVATMLKGVRGVVDRLQVQPNGVDDATLRKGVESALVADPATDSWEIAVTAEDGTVTLSGAVQSHAERELARTVAKGVHGVRAVEDELTVAYEADRPSAEILHDVQQRLRWDARIDDDLIDVQVRDGTVSLNGTVGSADERRQAIADAWVAGVAFVDAEDLVVQWWAKDEARAAARRDVTDDEIRQAVADAMPYDPRVISFRPQVAVVDGVVTLSGSVDSVKARRAAAEDARNTVGVRRVINHLKVSLVGEPTAAVVEVNARSALMRDAVVHADEVDVTVQEDGTARLEGEVASWFAREQAEDIVARVQGVTGIENLIDVSYAVPRWPHAYHDWDPIRHDFGFD
jgi:osmotically-inducible protein OsmY